MSRWTAAPIIGCGSCSARPIYLDSRAADSAAHMQQLFSKLRRRARRSGSSCSCWAARCRCCAARADVVWFEFAALCEGRAARTTISSWREEFRTVLLSDMPVFEPPEQDDAARRLIALVDEFYDQGTKLVVSAAAAPAELYRGGRLQPEIRAHRQPAGRDADAARTTWR